MSAPDPWTHIRVRKSTLARLRAMMARKVKATELGHADQNWPGESLTDDAMIGLIIAHVENDKRRMREAAARKRQARRDALEAMTFVPVDMA